MSQNNDTIYRQAAIDALYKCTDIFITNLPVMVDKADAYKALAELPPAQPEPKWIPVTKKAHPDTPIRVQIQMDNGWIITAYYQEGEWLSVPDCDEPLQDEWVEAWRELPEPYAERREE